MAYMTQTPTTDVLPWPQGHGFTGAKVWWDYVLSKDEERRLDNLMGLALLDENMGRRLVKERDGSLLSAFGLSEETQHWLRTIPANSLTELAHAIVSRPRAVASP